MKQPKVLTFRSESGNDCQDVPNAILVKRKEQRSKVCVKPDKAAEVCGKTPRSTPIND